MGSSKIGDDGTQLDLHSDCMALKANWIRIMFPKNDYGRVSISYSDLDQNRDFLGEIPEDMENGKLHLSIDAIGAKQLINDI